MKVPLSLLREYLDFSQTPSELAEVLTLAGLEVDEIRVMAPSFSGVVVCEVLEVEKHPFADRLKVAKVSEGTELLQIVCGAPNCRPGMKTALAKIGAELTDETGKKFKIKKGKLRDVESFGMLCGADELQLGQDHEGIIELPFDLPLGQDLAALHADVVFEISLTPNLGHCMSILGIARELSSHLGIPLKRKECALREEGEAIDTLVSVEVLDKKACAHYACRLVTGVKVGPSPDWLRRKVESCGVRSINNVVDVGNLVMLEWGQPLHLFDYDRIGGRQIRVQSQTSFEQMQTLDGQLRPVPPEVLLICDEAQPLAFAGVMGGQSSAVTEQTVSILIEAAHFSPQAIRRATRLLQLKSDSSQRFERGVDPLLVLPSLDYAALLLTQVASATVAKGVVDCEVQHWHPRKIACRTQRVNALLGTQLSPSEIAQLLRRLQMGILEEQAHQLLVEVPSFRLDITREVDLIEEVARVYGYNRIPKAIPRHVSSSLENAPMYEREKQMRVALMREGLQEVMTCDLISPEQSAIGLMHGMGEESVVKVLLSHSVDQSVLRTTLLPGLLQVVKYNQDHGCVDVSAFEVGRVHFKEKEQYVEPSVAGIVLAGKRSPHHWSERDKEYDFFDLKGIVENVCARFRVESPHFEASHFSQFHPGRQVCVKKGDILLGVLGEIHPLLLEKLGMTQRLFFAQLSIGELFALVPTEYVVTPLIPFPGSERDWTVTVGVSLPVETLLQAIRTVPSSLLQQVQLLDLYKSDQIGEDKKNVTFRFFYRDKEKTVSFDAVEKEHARIVSLVSSKLS